MALNDPAIDRRNMALRAASSTPKSLYNPAGASSLSAPAQGIFSGADRLVHSGSEEDTNRGLGSLAGLEAGGGMGALTALLMGSNPLLGLAVGAGLGAAGGDFLGGLFGGGGEEPEPFIPTRNPLPPIRQRRY